MATRTSNEGKIRSYGGRKKGDVTPGVVLVSQVVSVDPTETDETDDAARARVGASATTGEIFTLPKGAIPVSLMSLGTADSTGFIEFGSSADDDGFFVSLAPQTAGAVVGAAGALVTPAGILSDTVVTGTRASGTNTGTASFVFTYTFADDGKELG